MDEYINFGKGKWRVDSSRQTDRFLVVAVNDELAKIIDSFDCVAETFGSIQKVDDTETLMIDPKLMESKQWDTSEYSCIYSLSKNKDSKSVYVFSTEPASSLVSFQGKCTSTFRAQANRDTIQAKEAINRIRTRMQKRPAMHYMEESERREFSKRQNEERSKRIREERERVVMDSVQTQREHRHFEQDKEMIRQQVIHYLVAREYMSLNELVDRIRAPKSAIQDVLRVVADIQKKGKNINKYRLKDRYRFGAPPKST